MCVDVEKKKVKNNQTKIGLTGRRSTARRLYQTAACYDNLRARVWEKIITIYSGYGRGASARARTYRKNNNNSNNCNNCNKSIIMKNTRVHGEKQSRAHYTAGATAVASRRRQRLIMNVHVSGRPTDRRCINIARSRRTAVSEAR